MSALRSEQYEHQCTATELVSARYTIELQKQQIAQLQQAFAAADQRALVLSRELADCKLQGEAGGTRYATVTPLRPPHKPPDNDT
jgi:hypothetical protein